ncbi:hypothetical protein S245_071629 [Arachis hypogaea]
MVGDLHSMHKHSAVFYFLLSSVNIRIFLFTFDLFHQLYLPPLFLSFFFFFSAMPPSFDMISKMHPPREAWRLKVRVLRLWVVPSFGNHDVPNSMEMILFDEHVSPY